MKTHYVKIDSEYFDRIVLGEKTAEIRKHDRDYQVGDVLNMCSLRDGRVEIDRVEIEARISHIVTHNRFPEGLQSGYVLLSLQYIGTVPRFVDDGEDAS